MYGEPLKNERQDVVFEIKDEQVSRCGSGQSVEAVFSVAYTSLHLECLRRALLKVLDFQNLAKFAGVGLPAFGAAPIPVE